MLKRELVSSGAGCTDAFLCHVKTQEEVNKIRTMVLSYKPISSVVYIYPREKEFDIYIATSGGKMPSNEHYEKIRNLINLPETIEETTEKKIEL